MGFQRCLEVWIQLIKKEELISVKNNRLRAYVINASGSK